jgi:hypothetical protein
MGFEDDDIAEVIAVHTFGFAEISGGHLPIGEVVAVRRKFLHAAGHVDDVEIVVVIEGEGARFIELAEAGAA